MVCYLAHHASLEAEIHPGLASDDGDGGEWSSSYEHVSGWEELVPGDVVGVAGVLPQVEAELSGGDPAAVEGDGACVSEGDEEVQVAGVAIFRVDLDRPGLPAQKLVRVL